MDGNIFERLEVEVWDHEVQNLDMSNFQTWTPQPEPGENIGYGRAIGRAALQTLDLSHDVIKSI